MVVVNLYPFVQTVSKGNVSLEEAIENIDIGGPTMIRASAKNFPGVIIVTDPADYQLVLDKLKGAGLSLDDRKTPGPESLPAYRHVRYRHRPVPVAG